MVVVPRKRVGHITDRRMQGLLLMPLYPIAVSLLTVMTKQPSQSGDGNVTQARKQKTVESQDEEGNMEMDVVPIQGHPLEFQLGSPPDPFTSQVGCHDEIFIPGIHASAMVVDRWTPTEHSAFDRDIMECFPFSSSKAYCDNLAPNILKRTAKQNNKEIYWEDANGLIRGHKWLGDLLMACWEKGSFKNLRRLSQCLLRTFPVNIFPDLFSIQRSYRQVHLSPP
jgi:hypothetical protein